MKPSVCFAAMLFLSSAIATFAAENDSISVSIAVPYHGAHRTLAYYDPKAHFHVIITNHSDQPQNVWKEWCSWGYYGLSFEFADASGKTWTAKKKPGEWLKNFPDLWTLLAHDSLVIDVYFADAALWDGFPNPQGVSQTCKMRAVFEFSPDEESRRHKVWTGRAVSRDDEYEFYR